MLLVASLSPGIIGSLVLVAVGLVALVVGLFHEYTGY